MAWQRFVRPDFPYFFPMKKVLKPYSFFLVLLLCHGRSDAQTWRYSFGWSLTYSYGKIENQREIYPNDYSFVKAEPGLSADWPVNKTTTGFSAFENILRLGVYSAGLERKLNNRWSVLSGIEIGGRVMSYTEYAKRPGNKVSEENLANQARRSFLVCSVPLLVQYKLYANKIACSLLGGVYLNESFSSAKTTPFYSTPNGYFFYPSLSFGFKVGSAKNKGLAFECAYQQGLSNAIEDQVMVRSAAFANQQPQQFTATSAGSHLRVGLSYSIPFRQAKTTRAKSSGFVPYKERGIGRRLRIKTYSGNFRICFKDNETVDNDSIRVVFNKSTGEHILELTDTLQCLDFNVQDRLTNTIDVYAINEGRIKPNTMEIRYTDHRNKKRILVVNNPMDKYLRIKVIYLK